jgi:transposase-like protein
LQAACHRHGLRFYHVTHGNLNAVERVFRALKRRTHQFSNTFSHAEPNTAETRLQSFAVRWNSFN